VVNEGKTNFEKKKSGQKGRSASGINRADLIARSEVTYYEQVTSEQQIIRLQGSQLVKPARFIIQPRQMD